MSGHLQSDGLYYVDSNQGEKGFFIRSTNIRFEDLPELHVRNTHASAFELTKITKVKVEEKPLVGEKLVVDLIGPYCGKYRLILKDVGSQYIWYSILNRKSQAAEETIVWLRKVMNHLNRFKLNVCFELKQFCNANGIHREFTSPGHSYQNGSAENANGLMVKKVEKLMFESGLPRKYWEMALKHAVFSHNVHSFHNKDSPYERFHHRASDLKNGRLARTGDSNVDNVVYFPYYNRNKDHVLFETDKNDDVGSSSIIESAVSYAGGYGGAFKNVGGGSSAILESNPVSPTTEPSPVPSAGALVQMNDSSADTSHDHLVPSSEPMDIDAGIVVNQVNEAPDINAVSSQINEAPGNAVAFRDAGNKVVRATVEDVDEDDEMD
ncbi:unnamed protein product [Ambrosiozyma monospora]|uniref:Unnamed protein product n=1 Tax=Ambrosiozyma monospora TaxID=43982 RepID=A0ACB5SST8_AMBMO|nr:unnamed protein product [Ambrosiozyma monospora]